MYVDKSTARVNGTTYTRYLLRESRRQAIIEGKKTIKTTILNIPPWGEQTCEAIRFALGNQSRLRELDVAPTDFCKIVNDLRLTQRVALDIDSKGCVSGIDGRAVFHQGMRPSRAAIVLQRAQFRVERR